MIDSKIINPEHPRQRPFNWQNYLRCLHKARVNLQTVPISPDVLNHAARQKKSFYFSTFTLSKSDKHAPDKPIEYVIPEEEIEDYRNAIMTGMMNYLDKRENTQAVALSQTIPSLTAPEPPSLEVQRARLAAALGELENHEREAMMEAGRQLLRSTLDPEHILTEDRPQDLFVNAIRLEFAHDHCMNIR